MVQFSPGQVRELSYKQLDQQVPGVVTTVRHAQEWPEIVIGLINTVISRVCLTELQEKQRGKLICGAIAKGEAWRLLHTSQLRSITQRKVLFCNSWTKNRINWLKKYFTADYLPWFSIYQLNFSQHSHTKKKILSFDPNVILLHLIEVKQNKNKFSFPCEPVCFQRFFPPPSTALSFCCPKNQEKKLLNVCAAFSLFTFS